MDLRSCGEVNEPDSDINEKAASSATPEPDSEEETQIGSEVSTQTTQQSAQGSALQGGGTRLAEKQAIAQRSDRSNQPGPPVTADGSQAGNRPTVQLVGGVNQPVTLAEVVGQGRW